MGNMKHTLAISAFLLVVLLGATGPGSFLPSTLPVSALIGARMPVSLLGASKNAKAINADLVAYNRKVKELKLDAIVDSAINSTNAPPLLKAVGECQRLLVTTRHKVLNPTRGDNSKKIWSKNQKNAVKLILSAIKAEEGFLKDLSDKATNVIEGGGDAGNPLGGPKLAKDTSPPDWIIRLPFFTEAECPLDISTLRSSGSEKGKGGGGSTALYTMPYRGKEWKAIAKKDRSANYVDKGKKPDSIGPTEYEFSVYRTVYEAANTSKVDGLAIVYGWAWLNWGETRLEQMVMKPYPMDGLRVMKLLNDYLTNEIISGVDYWNVIAYVADSLLTGLNSLHSFGFTHNDMKPDNFMIDAKGRVWVIDLNGASTFEVGPNALTKEYCPDLLFRDSDQYAMSDKTKPWTYDNKKLDMFLLGNTLIHMTACPQTIDKADCQPKDKPAAAIEDYDASYKDFIAKLRNADPAARPTIAEAKAHEFLSEMDAAAARAILVNVANSEAFLRQWKTEHPDVVYRENVDIKKGKPQFLKMMSLLDTYFEQYQHWNETRLAEYLKIEKFIELCEYRKARLIGGGVSPTDNVFLKFAPALKKWERLVKQFPPPDPTWEPKKSKIAKEAEKDKGKKPAAGSEGGDDAE